MVCPYDAPRIHILLFFAYQSRKALRDVLYTNDLAWPSAGRIHSKCRTRNETEMLIGGIARLLSFFTIFSTPKGLLQVRKLNWEFLRCIIYHLIAVVAIEMSTRKVKDLLPESWRFIRSPGYRLQHTVDQSADSSQYRSKKQIGWSPYRSLR